MALSKHKCWREDLQQPLTHYRKTQIICMLPQDRKVLTSLTPGSGRGEGEGTDWWAASAVYSVCTEQQGVIGYTRWAAFMEEVTSTNKETDVIHFFSQ